MKVTGSNGVSGAGAQRGAKPQAASGFSVATPSSAIAGAAPAHASAGVGSLDALLAMQQVDGPLERRRRAVRRADRILDVLDELKLSLLDGATSEGALHRLNAAVREEQHDAADPGLQSVLRQIEARAAVELAKLEMSRKAA